MIKLINYQKYVSREVFISKTMIHSMQRENGMTHIVMEGGCSYTAKETPEEILAMPDIETAEKVIDWEQRRYELIRDFISARIIHKEDKLNYKEFIELHDLADIVIDNLKKNTRK